MSYQVLARKWRPRSFASLVGQDHVVRALRHALEQKRLHHAYLFTGTRGVGKTTLARILAKCLNCETGITAEPCNRCSACQEIDGGRFIDLLEVDAATNTKVDEMRQLLDTAQYAPTRGRFKVYVIDEVHMLSNSAFNAMLKTLEEPPEHLKFILATTDPQKIPVTVLSRCLQFNLKQMPPAAITGHLQRLLQEEGIACEVEALPLIARAAAGSMRDALSLLDQAIAHGGGRIGAADVRDMLGAVDLSYLLRLLEAASARDARQMLAIADEMQSRSLSFDAALQDLAGLLLKIAMAHAVPDALDVGLPERERIVALAGTIDAESAQLYYQIALQGRADLVLAPDEHSGFTMTLLRMLAFEPEVVPVAAGKAGGSASTPQRHLGSGSPQAGSGSPHASRRFEGDWANLVRQLQITGAARELARHASMSRQAEGVIELVVPRSMIHLAERNYQEKLKAALEQHFGKPTVLKVSAGEATVASVAAADAGDREARRADAVREVQGDRFVKDLVDMFDAKVIGSSVRANVDKTSGV